MRCTVVALSAVMVFTSACRADTPTSATPPPPPASQPSASSVYIQAQPPSDTGPRPRKPGGGGFGRTGTSGGDVVYDGGDGSSPWMMIHPRATSRPTEKGAYLGLAVSSVPTVLRDQLKLQKNVGLVVNFVEKDSPAEAAGFKQSDVLQKLDEQILINTQQFAVLVRIHDLNQPVRFTIIREAKPMEISAKLVQKDLAVLDESGRMQLDGPFERYVEMQAEQRANDAINRANDAVNRANDATSRTMEQVQRQLERMNRSHNFGLESRDENHSFSISDVNGHRTLKAKDKDGKMIYEGPIDTDEQIDQLPAEIKAKVKALPVWWPSRTPLMTTQPARMPVVKPVPGAFKVPPVPSAPSAPPAPPVPARAPQNPTAQASEQPSY